ncbi:phytanoyl-CoA dioxygenase family protein [Pseudohyphozyma bogoriensis]|nr:phytanoyl-CoA dioxygenase family protein [Pseudohyphozyma bogoriensis]
MTVAPITLPTVDEYDYAAGPVDRDAVLASIIRAGGVVIRNAVSPEAIAQMEKDFRPFIEKDKKWEGTFFPPTTRRVSGLVGKSRTFTNEVVAHPVYWDITHKILTTTFKCWVGDEMTENVSQPQLSNTIVFSIGPAGDEAINQALHRDDIVWHKNNVACTPEEWTNERECTLGWFIAGKPTTKQNGATRFIPGSHLWDTSIPPDEKLAYYAELQPGDGLLLLASAYHGGSANRTTDQERLVFSCFTGKGALKQEENMYLAIPQDVVKEYPVELQRFFGYQLSAPFGNWVNFEDPMIYPGAGAAGASYAYTALALGGDSPTALVRNGQTTQNFDMWATMLFNALDNSIEPRKTGVMEASKMAAFRTMGGLPVSPYFQNYGLPVYVECIGAETTTGSSKSPLTYRGWCTFLLHKIQANPPQAWSQINAAAVALNVQPRQHLAITDLPSFPDPSAQARETMFMSRCSQLAAGAWSGGLVGGLGGVGGGAFGGVGQVGAAHGSGGHGGDAMKILGSVLKIGVNLSGQNAAGFSGFGN